jgi:hypothetical protein
MTCAPPSAEVGRAQWSPAELRVVRDALAHDRFPYQVRHLLPGRSPGSIRSEWWGSSRAKRTDPPRVITGAGSLSLGYTAYPYFYRAAGRFTIERKALGLCEYQGLHAGNEG